MSRFVRWSSLFVLLALVGLAAAVAGVARADEPGPSSSPAAALSTGPAGLDAPEGDYWGPGCGRCGNACGYTDSGLAYPDDYPDPDPACSPRPLGIDPGSQAVAPGAPALDSIDGLDHGDNQITTLFAWNNFGNFGGGAYFDVENVGSQPVELISFDVNVSPGGGSTVDVWYRPGTHVGAETSPAGWTLMGTDNAVVAAGLNQPTHVDQDGTLIIQPGDSYGLAFSGGQQWRYTNGTGGNQLFNDGALELRLGSTNNVAFSSAPFTPRVWNGTVYYNFVTLGVPGVDPNRQLGSQVHLPILNFQGQDDVCRTWIEVQVIGPEPSKAVLVTWGEPGFCPPQCAGPLKVECSGLLIPGSTWNFLGAQVPTGSKSGILFKFTAAQLSEFGLDQVFGFDDVIADLMCETLFFGVVGDCDDYRRFKKAYNEGLEFAGINQVIAAGAGFLAVDVLRHCPGDVTPGVEVSGKYNGIAGDHLGAYDPVFGGFAYYAPLLYADKAGFNSIMYIQNGGLECSSVEIWFKAQDDCLRARICEIFTLAPGETYQFDATDCVGPDWQGSAWLRSSQPLGIVVDIIGRDVMMTYIGEPSQFFYAFDPLDPADDIGFSMGNQVAFGPLMYSEYQGWDSGVQVQNLSGIVAAKVKVYFLDRSGDIITTLVDWICPRGSQTFFLPVIANLPGNWVGSIRVESQEWWSPGDPIVSPPDIVGVVTLIKYNDAARTAATEALAYNLLPEHKIYIWQIGSFIGGTFSGVGLIAIPSLLKDLDATGVTSEVAIMNVIPKPGFTDFAIFIYDQNGLLDYICEKLNEKQVEYINLQTWGYVNPGFKGSAIISAVFWEHDVFSETGIFLRNLVGLGAVAVERSGTRLGEDVPGDEAAGDRGIPFQADENVSLEFAWGGPGLPNCPGVPPGFGFVPEDPESVGLSGN